MTWDLTCKTVSMPQTSNGIWTSHTPLVLHSYESDNKRFRLQIRIHNHKPIIITVFNRIWTLHTMPVCCKLINKYIQGKTIDQFYMATSLKRIITQWTSNLLFFLLLHHSNLQIQPIKYIYIYKYDQSLTNVHK